MEYFILILLLIVLLFLCVFGVFIVYMLIRTGVPFIPTHDNVVTAMIGAVEFRENFNIYELGCGNGKMLFEIKKQCDRGNLENVKITGYELISPLVWWIKFKRQFLPKTSNQIEIFSRDFYKQDLSDADIIFCYLFPHIMQRIYRDIWPTLRTGTVLVSHAFKIDNIVPKKVIKIAKTTIYVYEK